MRFRNVDEVLEFAIGKEQEAHDLYTRVAETVTRPGMRETFLELAALELEHRRRLESIRDGGAPGLPTTPPEDLAISETVVEPEPGPDMTYAEVLRYAMKAEQRAHDLYADLARLATDDGVRELFAALAREELEHKRVFETEYDEVVLEGP